MMKLKTLLSMVFFGCIGSTTLNAQETIVLSGGAHPLVRHAESILTEAYHRIGNEIETMELPVKRSLAMANSGDIDGEIFRGTVNKKDFPNLIRIPVVLGHGEIVVFTEFAKLKVDGWESIKPYVIGIQGGVQVIETGTMGMRIETVTDPEQLFNMLILGRVDIVVLPRDVGLMTLNAMNLKGIKMLEPPLQRDELFHYLHKKNEPLVPKITAALREMEKEGLIQAFRNQGTAD